MTIKGPHAHEYSGGLGDLLGWGGDNRYDYADEYDVEAHRQYLYEQEKQRYQQQQRYEANNGGVFSNALNNPNPPSRQSVVPYNNTTENTTTQVQSTSDAEAEAIKKEKCDKLKKQAMNAVFFIIIFLIWFASGAI